MTSDHNVRLRRNATDSLLESSFRVLTGDRQAYHLAGRAPTKPPITCSIPNLQTRRALGLATARRWLSARESSRERRRSRRGIRTGGTHSWARSSGWPCGRAIKPRGGRRGTECGVEREGEHRGPITTEVDPIQEEAARTRTGSLDTMINEPADQYHARSDDPTTRRALPPSTPSVVPPTSPTNIRPAPSSPPLDPPGRPLALLEDELRRPTCRFRDLAGRCSSSLVLAKSRTPLRHISLSRAQLGLPLRLSSGPPEQNQIPPLYPSSQTLPTTHILTTSSKIERKKRTTIKSPPPPPSPSPPTSKLPPRRPPITTLRLATPHRPPARSLRSNPASPPAPQYPSPHQAPSASGRSGRGPTGAAA